MSPCPKTGLRGKKGLALILALALSAISPVLPAQEGPAKAASKEYQVKAAFLYQFAQFTSWPESAFAGPESALVIGVLGEDPFGGYLDMVVKGEKKDRRSIRIHRFTKVEEVAGCHILFLAGSQDGELERILPGLKDKIVLTVGETDRFTRSGGMVRFEIQSTKIRFKVNLRAIQAADLNMSSKLLRLADIVSSGGVKP